MEKLTQLSGLANGSQSHSSSHLLAGVTTTTDGFVVDSCNFSRIFVRHLNGRRKPSNNSSSFYSSYESDEGNESDDDDSAAVNVIRPDKRAPEIFQLTKNNYNNKSVQLTNKQSQLDDDDWTKVSLLEDAPLDTLFPT